jgi:hypothetical protein
MRMVEIETVSLRVAAGLLGNVVSTRKDVNRNGIDHMSAHPADLSAQTIRYIDLKLSGHP